MNSNNDQASFGIRNLQDPAAAEEISTLDLVVLARIDSPTQAHLMRNLLEQAGIPVFMFDSNILQMDMLLTPAIGGVRLRVPREFFVQGQEVLAQYESGALDLEPETKCTPTQRNDSSLWQAFLVIIFFSVLIKFSLLFLIRE